MQPARQPERRRAERGAAPLARVLGAALLVAAALALAGASGAAAPLQRLCADAMLRLAAAYPPSLPPGLPDVTLVTLDPRSLRAIEQWPWPRSIHARAVEALSRAGAAAIAFDIDFSTPREADDDARFAAAIARSGRVVLAAFRQRERLPGGAEIEVANVPAPEFAAAARGVGSVLMPVDPDGVVRRAPHRTEIAGRLHPSLAEAALEVALARRAPRAEPDAGVSPAGAVARPPAPGAAPTARIDYRRAQPPVPRIAMIDVLEGRFDPRDVEGRTVLIGATAAEFQDLWATPLGPARPGVWIQALLYRTRAAERAGAPVLRAAPPAALLGVLLGVSLAAAAIARGEHASRRAALGALAVALGTGDLALLVRSGWLLDPVLPLCAVAIHHGLGLESVRRRFGRRLARQERSLSTLDALGRVAASPAEGGALGTALRLLGDVIDASAVALLRVERSAPGGAPRLARERIEWRRRGAGPIGDDATARAALAAGEVRIGSDDAAAPAAARGRGTPREWTCVPLRSGGDPVGVLVVERDTLEPLDPTAARTLSTVAAQLALSVDNLRLVEHLRATFESSIEAIASAVEARDGYTESHCRRLAVFSTRMAARLGLPDDEIEAIRLGALLHDVGKIGIRDEVLLKPDRFTQEERTQMQSHAAIGHHIVRSILGMSDTTLACVRHHHERWDGSGYPDRLHGEAIPIGARIVAVVDVWDALSTSRPYKPAFEQPRVLDILRKSRGTHFDPALVDLFLQLLDEEGDEMLALLGGPGHEADA